MCKMRQKYLFGILQSWLTIFPTSPNVLHKCSRCVGTKVHNTGNRHTFSPVVCRNHGDCHYRYFSSSKATSGGFFLPVDPVCTNLIIENIYKEIKSWMCKRIDKTDSRQLPVLERASALNRLLMAHCFDVLMARECPFSKFELSSPDDEICLPAICAVIDKARQYNVGSFVIGTLQYRKLDVISKIFDVTPENVFMNILNCRNKISGADASVPFAEDWRKGEVSVTLVGNSTHSSTIFPLTLGVAKAMQILENDDTNDFVWPIVCYDANDIKDKSIYSNIVQGSGDKNFYIGGAIHIVLNEVEEELSLKHEHENQCKFVKVFADFLKAPIVHVKAEDVDSVINVMHLVADFKKSYKRDIVVNLLVNQAECYPIKQLTLPELMEELVTQERPPLAASYMKYLADNKVISKTPYEQRREECLNGIQELYARQDFVVVEDKTSSSMLKLIMEPPTASPLSVLTTIGEVIGKAPSSIALRNEDSKLFEERNSELKENKLGWSTCELLAYGTLLQEEINIHKCITKKGKKSTLIISDKVSGKNKNILTNTFPYMGNYDVYSSSVPEYTMAGFEMGYSTVMTNTLNIWIAPDNVRPCVLQSIMKQYILYTVRNTPSRVTFIIPDFSIVFEKNARKYSSSLKKQIVNIYFGMMEDKKHKPKPHCTIVNVSSPANYFHILRKQAKTPRMCPLLLYVPHMYKSPKNCFSKMEDLSGESCFQPLLYDDKEINTNEVEHIILCSGKIYYDLIEERNKRNFNKNVAIGSIEQIYPFPTEEVKGYIRKNNTNGNAKLWWAQQEQYEDGWWSYIQENLKIEDTKIKYAGRCQAARPDYSSPQLSDGELSYIFESITRNT